MAQEELHETLKEGLYHGEVRCETCGHLVNLGDLKSLEEAGKRWNRHLVDCDETSITESDVPA